MRRTIASVAIAVAAASIAVTEAPAQATLASVKHKGTLTCGSNGVSPGFGVVDAQGHWTGLDVDFCRAIAAAIFDDPAKVHFIALSGRDRFKALQSGEIDILVRNTTATMSRETEFEIDFPIITYFDGQGFLVRKKLNLSSAKELNGRSICTAQSTTTELNLADYFRLNNMTYETISFATTDEAKTAYDAGRCDAFTSDISALHAARLIVSDPDDHVVLPEIISKEPLAPAVRHGDNNWGDIVKFVHTAMLNAEELGVTKMNVEQMKSSTNPEVRRLLGIEDKLGDAIGFTNDWAVRIIKHVGNYGEVFERNLGEGSRLKIKRGRNALWTKGGLQYGIPIR